MPTTRSVTRSSNVALPPSLDISQSAQEFVEPSSDATPTKTNGKRKAKPEASKSKSKKPRSAHAGSIPPSSAGLNVAGAGGPTGVLPEDPPVMVPAELTFSLADAKAHLIKADVRWEDIFKRMKCKPYEHLERVDPFRTLTTSILGQQISWLAARSITHRFIRLFDPSLPEKPTDNAWATGETFFPTAHQVSNLDIATLRTAGLSGRKAEYVLDLATRFADGRLSTQKLMEADDDELARLLIEVRGIGRWTVDMFAIFSLRRPDILPVGDLGVQRGVLRWFLALHSPTYKFGISSKKLPKMPGDDSADKNGTDTPPAGTSQNEAQGFVAPRGDSPDVSSVPPAAVVPPTPARNGESQSGVATPSSSLSSTLTDIPSFPPLFTPSINQALHANTAPPPLPEGLTTSILKSRLDGKKKIKGAILTPKEMEDLTEPWRPYRSIGVYYMWSLAEESG